jgi:predicted nucleic-acid-binding protein
MFGGGGVVAIDTNVLIRLLVADEPTQARASRRLFASQSIFIPDTVLLESEWVLRAAYELMRADICTAFRQVCGLPNVVVSDAQRIRQVIDWHEMGLDFADAFHLALSDDGSEFKTFDIAFIRQAKKHTDRYVARP